MSWLPNSSVNRSASNVPGNRGRSFPASFPGQSRPGFHHTLNHHDVTLFPGTLQGLHNVQGSFNVPNNMPGTYTSINSMLGNVPTGVVQQPTGNLSGRSFASNNIPGSFYQLSHGHGTFYGYTGVNNRGSIGVIGNPGFSSNNTTGVCGSMPRNLPTSASITNRNAIPGLSVPGIVSLEDYPYLGNAGPSISAGRGLSTPGIASRMNLSANSGGSGSLTMQGQNRLTSGVLPPQGIVPNTFSYRDKLMSGAFPQGGNADYGMDMQPQRFSMGRPAEFNLGGSYSRQQHAPSASSSGFSFSSVNNQDRLGPSGFGLRPLNSTNSVSIQQYEQHENQSQLQNQSFREPGMTSMQAEQSNPDPFGLVGFLTAPRMKSYSPEEIYKEFGYPWSETDEPAEDDTVTVPQCYNAKQPPALHQGYFSKFTLDTLFYIFYSMPRDEAQLYAANELYNRGWFYHNEIRLWFTREVSSTERVNRRRTYERGSYLCFDPNTFTTIRKDNFVIHYSLLEKIPALPQR